ncbi:hypothetical protein ACFX11_026631 [Malus domestica]
MRCMWILGPILSHLKTLAICAKESRWRGGELQVDSVMHVASIIRRTQCFKPNYFFVIIDFLSRQRYFTVTTDILTISDPIREKLTLGGCLYGGTLAPSPSDTWIYYKV